MLFSDGGRNELVHEPGRQKRRQIHRPAMGDAVLDLETLPVKINVRRVAPLELQTPADRVIHLAVGHDLLEGDTGMGPFKFGDGRVENRALGLRGKCVRDPQSIRRRSRQAETMSGQQESRDHERDPKPGVELEGCAHGGCSHRRVRRFRFSAVR